MPGVKLFQNSKRQSQAGQRRLLHHSRIVRAERAVLIQNRVHSQLSRPSRDSTRPAVASYAVPQTRQMYGLGLMSVLDLHSWGWEQ
jgi:hypothetical protein